MSLEQRVAALEAQQPRSGKRDLLDGHSHPSSPLRAKVLVPQTVLPFDGSAATGLATVTPTTSVAIVGLVYLHASIVADRIAYFPTGGGADPTVMRLALYREDGQLKHFDVLDEVDDAGSAERNVTFDAVFLSPGNYYIFCCVASGGGGPPVVVYNTGSAFSAGASGEPDVEGVLTLASSGVAADTIDPTAINSGTAIPDRTLAFRLDGQ